MDMPMLLKSRAVNVTWQGFLAGVVCGVILMVLAGAAWLWREPQASWNEGQRIIYDRCLMSNAGNKVVCDAVMRELHREAEKARRELQAEEDPKDPFAKSGAVRRPTDPH
jgi:hypothetical protein